MKLQLFLIALLFAGVYSETITSDIISDSSVAANLARWSSGAWTACSEDAATSFLGDFDETAVTYSRNLVSHGALSITFDLVVFGTIDAADDGNGLDALTLSFVQNDSNKVSIDLLGASSQDDTNFVKATLATPVTDYNCNNTNSDTVIAVEILLEHDLHSIDFTFQLTRTDSSTITYGLQNFIICGQEAANTGFSADAAAVCAEAAPADCGSDYDYDSKCVSSAHLLSCFDDIAAFDTSVAPTAGASDHFEYSVVVDNVTSEALLKIRYPDGGFTVSQVSDTRGTPDFNCLTHELTVGGYRINENSDFYSYADSFYTYTFTPSSIEDNFGRGCGNPDTTNGATTYECPATFNVVANHATQFTENFTLTFIVYSDGFSIDQSITLDVQSGSVDVNDPETVDFVVQTTLQYCGEDSTCATDDYPLDSSAENPVVVPKDTMVYLKHSITNAHYSTNYQLDVTAFGLYSLDLLSTISETPGQGFVIFSFTPQIAGPTLQFSLTSQLQTYTARRALEEEENYAGESVTGKIFITVEDKQEIISNDSDLQNEKTVVIVEKSDNNNNLVIAVVSVLAVIVVASIIGAIFYLKNVRNAKQAPAAQENAAAEDKYKLPQDVEMNNKCVTSER